jgi:hypothetical protein
MIKEDPEYSGFSFGQNFNPLLPLFIINHLITKSAVHDFWNHR